MGAWGTGVFENDYALDEMNDIIEVCTTPEATKAYTLAMLNTLDEYKILLAIGFVDASLNGAEVSVFGDFYNYKDFLDNLTPMEDLRGRALRRLSELGTDGWTDKESRQYIYDILENRLTQEV